MENKAENMKTSANVYCTTFQSQLYFLYVIIEHCLENIPISDNKNEFWLVKNNKLYAWFKETQN